MYKKSIYNIIKKENDKIYLYNSFSKAKIVVKKENFLDEMIREINSGNDDFIEYKKFLEKNNFIVEEGRDEIASLNYLFNKRFFSNYIKSIILVPTLNCNFGCHYCFEKELTDGFKTSENYYNALKNNIISDKNKFKHLNLSLFGGEPFLHKKQLFDFLDFIKINSNEEKYTFDVSVTTNGSLLNEEDIEKLIDYNCRFLQITLDGSREQHNITRAFKNGKPSFDILVDIINMIARKIDGIEKFVFALRINLLNNTLDEVSKILDLFDEKYRKNINVMIRTVYNTELFTESNSNENSNLDEFNKLAVSKGYRISVNERLFIYCEACCDVSSFHLLPDLSVWKCVSDLKCTGPKIGYMNEDGSISYNADAVINWYKAVDFTKNKKCIGCPNAPDCLGGCPLYYYKVGERRCEDRSVITNTYQYSCLGKNNDK